VTYDGDGINLVLAKQGDNPTIQTDGYMLFGTFSVTMRAAGGQGIISSLILLSDDLDEVDWEFTGTNTGQVESNYFGKGDTTTFDRAAYHGVGTPQSSYHTYTVNWTPDTLQWIIDGAVVRTLNYNDAQGGARYPQTPMRVRLGIWAGGDPSNGEGTVEWAGGPTNYGAAPFSMSVQTVEITNYSPGASYTYGDTSGSYQSIKIAGGTLLGNSKGASSVTTASVKSGSVSTSLSIASVPTNNPLTANPTTSAVVNVTNATTLSTVGAPTSVLPTSTSSTAKPSGNPAMRLEAAGMSGIPVVMGAIALGFGLLL
jgi:beta-glucanase (GH16 family)